ncbi:MAG: 5-oxoprolinase subunit PxpA [Betaproteobacteria bacterium]|nr:5-oxoprolinase subunit PxpA [Betaproteobacteria bacterium]
MRIVDLNADLGESFGAWKMGDDERLLEVVTSANVACGFHAGDPVTIRHTVHEAVRRDVAVGAHPSLPDLQGFGRRRMEITAGEVYDLVVYQIAAVAGFAKIAGTRLHHVKAHGALYNMAATNPSLAQAIVAAVRDFDADLVLYAAAGSQMIDAAEAAGIAVASEVFADRAYRKDGTLVPRSEAGAVIVDQARAIAQALDMICDRRVLSVDGLWVPLRADTICVHGDSPGAVTLAVALRSRLESEGVTVRIP